MTTATLGRTWVHSATTGAQRVRRVSPQRPSPQRPSPLRPSPLRPTPLRLTPRGRRFFTVLVSFPLVVGAFWFAMNGGGAIATLEGSEAGFEYVMIQPGESLWQLAEQLAPQADPRDVIAEVMQLNQLDSADVFAGQELAIPATYLD